MNDTLLRFIIAEHILRLNKAIEKVYGGKVIGGQIFDEEGKITYSSLD